MIHLSVWKTGTSSLVFCPGILGRHQEGFLEKAAFSEASKTEVP